MPGQSGIRLREQHAWLHRVAGLAAGDRQHVNHYIAHFHATGDEARLQGLLFGCRKFLFRPTLAGSVAAALLFGKYTPEAAAMVSRLAVTMAFIGLMQAVGMWALASRWLKVALLYGASGLVYWLVLLAWGKSPPVMLHLMPVAAGSAFGLLFVSWLVAMRSTPIPSNKR